ncbi:FtsJ-like methyltransferase-domain-containing protein [Bombardia bombarda]|uniref:rRNA methyltransferase 2, mitochondrial n=1 Tax=Bombardia bombarda TaxID=252184 RepID=A0AA40BVA9_9PEZI|nr:FtsJ-like methyltransferase-domain-containing protein [Bombardia bombarda]
MQASSPWMTSRMPSCRRRLAALACLNKKPSRLNSRTFSSQFATTTTTTAITRPQNLTEPTLYSSPLSSYTTKRRGSSSSNSRWKQRQGNDSFAREARVQGLKSRAAFKLLEMDAKYHLFRAKQGQMVVDLGFAPGSWSQVALERTKPDGRIVGIDIIPAQPPKGVSSIQGNFLSPGVQALVKQHLLESERKRKKVVAQRKMETEVEAREAKEAKENEDGEAGVQSVVDETGEGKEVAAEEAEEAEQEATDRLSYIDLEKMAALEISEAIVGPASDGATSETTTSSTENQEEAKNLRLVDVVLSDMSAPWPQTSGYSVNTLSNPYIRMMNTSGIAFRDHTGSMDLCRAALLFASDTLKTGGHFVCKFYQGAEDKTLELALKKMFNKVHREKPESSRSVSLPLLFIRERIAYMLRNRARPFLLPSRGKGLSRMTILSWIERSVQGQQVQKCPDFE